MPLNSQTSSLEQNDKDNKLNVHNLLLLEKVII